MASPPGQCTHPHHKGEGIFCPHAPAITKVAITHLGGTAARSSSTPSFLLESLEKVCSSWACHPSSHYLSFRPIEALYTLPVLSWAGWGGVYSTGKWTTTQDHVHSQGQCRTHTPPPASPHPSASTTRGTGMHFLLSGHPPKRATHGTYTPPWQAPKGNTGLREMTPALSFRHLRDDLEHSRGTTKGQTRHAHTPTEGRQCSHNTALPTMERVGRAAHRTHTMKTKPKHLLCQKTNSPTDAPR